MIFSPRIGLKPLGQLCARLSNALEAGVDVRKVWQSEAERARGPMRSHMQTISAKVAAGESTAEALAATGNYFPEVFRELTDVGEQTGRIGEVYGQLASHYQHQLQLRRAFLSAITWPMIQLTLAVSVIGLLIWVMGFIASLRDGKPLDILGLGLVGTRGLMIYLMCVACIVAATAFFIYLLRRGGPWSGPLQRVIWRVPMLGPALKTLALSRFTWSLFVTLESGMPLRRAIELSLKSTRSSTFVHHTDKMLLSIRQGREIYETFRDSKEFPTEFLDAVQVGEHSGRLVETLAILSRQQEESARSAFGILTTIAGFLVWCLVAAVIILMIFRVFSFYQGSIDEALKMR